MSGGRRGQKLILQSMLTHRDKKGSAVVLWEVQNIDSECLTAASMPHCKTPPWAACFPGMAHIPRSCSTCSPRISAGTLAQPAWPAAPLQLLCSSQAGDVSAERERNFLGPTLKCAHCAEQEISIKCRIISEIMN